MKLKQQLAIAAMSLAAGTAATAADESPLFGTHDYVQGNGQKVSISTVRIASKLDPSGNPYAASNTLKTTVSVDGQTIKTGIFACAARVNYGPNIGTGDREANNDSASGHINALLPAGSANDKETRDTAVRVGAFVVLGNCIAPAIKAPGQNI